MKRIWTRFLTAAVVAGIAAVLIASFASALAAARAPRPVVELRQTKLGKILVAANGFTIYVFTKDKRNVDNCQSTKGCASVWPAVTTSGKPTGGSGVKGSMLGTIKLKSGAKQVTYGGHPLYTFSGDSQAGETSYVNTSEYGGRWVAINASGGEVK